MDISDTLLTASHAFNTGTGVLGGIALIAVALVVVRPVDVRAAWLIAASFAVDLGLAILWPVLNVVIPWLISGGDLTVAYGLLGMLSSLVRVAAVVLLAFGIVTLARSRLRAKSATQSST